MEKVHITDFHLQSLKQKWGWRLQLLGKWRDIQKMWSQKERKTEIENRIPKPWLLLINMREVKAPLTRRNDLRGGNPCNWAFGHSLNISPCHGQWVNCSAKRASKAQPGLAHLFYISRSFVQWSSCRGILGSRSKCVLAINLPGVDGLHGQCFWLHHPYGHLPELVFKAVLGRFLYKELSCLKVDSNNHSWEGRKEREKKNLHRKEEQGRAGQGGAGKWGRWVLSIPWVIEIYNSDQSIMFKSGVVELALSVIFEPRRERQAEPCRFEVSPVYRVSSRTLRTR